MKKVKRRKKWCKFRHKIIFIMVRGLLTPVSKLLYGAKVKKFTEPTGKKQRQYLIIFNHQTAFDQFFVSMAFKNPVYYLASEDLFSNGFVSKLIRYLVAPIPIKKQTTDMKAVYDCARVAKEGGTIALAPEGNRTYSGKTEYFKSSIVKLIRLVNLPLAIFLIKGGYGVQPRWSDVRRKGSLHAGVSRIVEPEEYKNLTDEQLYELIKSSLYVFEGKDTGVYKHKKSAEYLERAMYVCPECGFSEFYSKNNKIYCKNCDLFAEYLANKGLKWNKENVRLDFVNDWYEYQNDFVNGKDTLSFTDSPLYTEIVSLKEVLLYKRKVLLSKKAKVSLYGDKITAEYKKGKKNVAITFDFDTTTAVTVLGRNKVNVYFNERVFQIKGSKRMNALKYVNLFYRAKTLKGENEYAGFLGL